MSLTYHIRLCELDHDLGSFSRKTLSKAEAVRMLREMFRRPLRNFRALERLREFEL